MIFFKILIALIFCIKTQMSRVSINRRNNEHLMCSNCFFTASNSLWLRKPAAAIPSLSPSTMQQLAPLLWPWGATSTWLRPGWPWSHASLWLVPLPDRKVTFKFALLLAWHFLFFLNQYGTGMLAVSQIPTSQHLQVAKLISQRLTRSTDITKMYRYQSW